MRVSGPPVAFSAKYALTLGMAIHELATNAAKHGALSTQAGEAVPPAGSGPAGTGVRPLPPKS